MSDITQENQDSRYGPLVRKLLKIISISGSKRVLRHSGQHLDPSTEIVHEIGTTDVAVGDATAEVMLTTLGKIPSEMYYLEDTTVNLKLPTQKINLQQTSQFARAVAASTEASKTNEEYSNHSPVLFALLTALVVILLLCCITACLIAKSKRKNSFFGKSNMECEPGCTGMSQPLLNKTSDSSNKTSISSLRK